MVSSKTSKFWFKYEFDKSFEAQTKILSREMKDQISQTKFSLNFSFVFFSKDLRPGIYSNEAVLISRYLFQKNPYYPN